jgi:hypothetical protein
MKAGELPSAGIGAGDLVLLTRRLSHHAPVMDRGISERWNFFSAADG